MNQLPPYSTSFNDRKSLIFVAKMPVYVFDDIDCERVYMD
uniref:Uncharacterized protein n=1 Tax=Anguilla anguilla TaxID=7936 RepID=A0A0E9RFK2_ANGAN